MCDPIVFPPSRHCVGLAILSAWVWLSRGGLTSTGVLLVGFDQETRPIGALKRKKRQVLGKKGISRQIFLTNVHEK